MTALFLVAVSAALALLLAVSVLAPRPWVAPLLPLCSAPIIVWAVLNAQAAAEREIRMAALPPIPAEAVSAAGYRPDRAYLIGPRNRSGVSHGCLFYRDALVFVAVEVLGDRHLRILRDPSGQRAASCVAAATQ